jgi:hypothetical protein
MAVDPLGLVESINRRLVGRYFHVYSRLRPEDVKGIVGSRAYVPSIARNVIVQDLQKQIEHMLWDRKPVLLTGRSGVGKTQMAADICYSMGLRTCIPKEGMLEELSTALWMRYFSKSSTVLLLDDLHSHIRSVGPAASVIRAIEQFTELGGSVLATSTVAGYEQLVAWHLDRTRFEVVLVPEWDEDEGKQLASALNVAFDPNSFDGTPASLILGFERQREALRKLGADALRVLRSLKLLCVAGLVSDSRAVDAEILRIASDILNVEDIASSAQALVTSGLAQEHNGQYCLRSAIAENVVVGFPIDPSHEVLMLEKLGGALVGAARRPEAIRLVAWCSSRGVTRPALRTLECLLATMGEATREDRAAKAELLGQRALIHWEVGDQPQARADAAGARALDPENAEIRHNYLAMMLSDRDIQEIITQYAELELGAPDN